MRHLGGNKGGGAGRDDLVRRSVIVVGGAQGIPVGCMLDQIDVRLQGYSQTGRVCSSRDVRHIFSEDNG